MPITVTEKSESRKIESGSNKSGYAKYIIRGITAALGPLDVTEADAITALIDYAPASIDIEGASVPRQGYGVKIITEDIWLGWARWAFTSSSISEGESTYQFDTSGGTQHITQSLATVNSYAIAGATPPNHKNAIGVTKSGVAGVDIPVKAYSWSESHFFDDSVVTDTYKQTLSNLTGDVNDATFRGYAQGEVLFKYATGSKRGDGDWEINFHFSAHKSSNLYPQDRMMKIFS